MKEMAQRAKLEAEARNEFNEVAPDFVLSLVEDIEHWRAHFVEVEKAVNSRRRKHSLIMDRLTLLLRKRQEQNKGNKK